MASYANFDHYKSENVSRNVPEVSGVYLIRVLLQSGKYQYIYVGQAVNLRSRLLDHLRPTDPNKCLRDHVGKYALSYTWVELKLQVERDQEEKAKYEKYKPECNLISPPA